MDCILLRVDSHAFLNENSVNIIACFRRICLILQTINYKGNEKYVLVLVHHDDEIITDSITFFSLTLIRHVQDQTDLSHSQ